MLKKNKKFFIASCIVIFITNVCWILIMGQLPAQVGNTFLEETARPIDYSSKLFCSSRNLSVCFGSAYFM